MWRQGCNRGYEVKQRTFFETDLQGGDLSYSIDTRDDYKRLDAGLIGGLGYKFRKEIKSMSVGVHYYQGLVDITKLRLPILKRIALCVYESADWRQQRD
ncbi:MAG: outer membrane beta-barrel protein [Flammeovirgaceae bacterium]|nr:outer membrane beta-barrel protein [Flammeovirgaceae bacterium]